MKFNPKARLDRSRMRRRSGSAGGGGFRMPGGGGGGGGLPIPAGGGIVGIILVVVLLVVASQCGSGLLPGGGSGDTATEQTLEDCNRQAAEGNVSQRCKIEYSVNSLAEFWTDELPAQAGITYDEASTIDFSGGVNTQCGQASSAMGPFYCPPDQTVYLDLTFFDDMLEGRLGATGGDFAEAYVVAHEYGHHVQNLTGVLARAQSRETGPTSPGVRVELQADCYAGVWANHATTVADDEGEVFITELTDEDIAEAIDAAQAVGDDYIQQRTQGRVNPEQWTHGSAEQRMRWFQRGLESGQMSACDTFATDSL
jgi:predicted metalloprotease